VGAHGHKTRSLQPLGPTDWQADTIQGGLNSQMARGLNKRQSLFASK